MTEILGYIGLIITLLVVVPASLVALIRVFINPIKEIANLWISLVDTIVDIIDSIKKPK